MTNIQDMPTQTYVQIISDMKLKSQTPNYRHYHDRMIALHTTSQNSELEKGNLKIT